MQQKPFITNALAFNTTRQHKDEGGAGAPVNQTSSLAFPLYLKP